MTINSLGNKSVTFIVGRAATAIYLILKCLNKPGKEVIVPGNLCYAAIYPVLYACMKPCFCDVENYTGNVYCENIRAVISENTVAAIIPHMYGNPVIELPEIYSICRKNNIFLIQDCASGMGIKPSCYNINEISDATIYSTGYSKTLDLGGGGIIVCQSGGGERVEQYRELEKELSSKPGNAEEGMTFFSHLYRLIRNEGQGLGITDKIFKVLPETYKDYFIFRIDDKERERIINGVKMLPQEIDRRKRVKKLYDNLLASVLDRIHYPYHEGAVPWRYNLLVEPEIRRRLIDNCLSKGMPVSDWYPSVLPMFGVTAKLSGISWHEERILNFSMNIPDCYIEEICKVIVNTVDD